MKKGIICVALVVSFLSCKEEPKVNIAASNDKFDSFGDVITVDDVKTQEEISKIYANLKPNDTVVVKFASKIESVCQKKGCWVNLALDNNETAAVKFKDYAFFVPLDSQGKEVIIEGKAFLKEEKVADLQHLAEDAGKTKEEIAAITEPELKKSFLANGVLIAKK